MLVETRLGRLFVEERGEGTPLVLWHSLLCEGGMWRRVLDALAERHRVINIDGPGHGRSANVRRAFSLEECAQAAVEVMDALSVSRAHWGGLSWGGMIGMRLALYYPERLRSLALIDTNAGLERRSDLPSYRVMAFVARRVGALPLLLDRVEAIFFSEATRAGDRAVVRDFRDKLARMDPRSIGHSVDAVIFGRRDLRERIRAIELPTLVVVGTEDVATPPRCAREIADAIAGAELLQIPAAGHLSVLEQPAPIAAAMLEHFARVDAA